MQLDNLERGGMTFYTLNHKKRDILF